MTKNEPEGKAADINMVKMNLASSKDSTTYVKSEDKNDPEKIAKKEALESRCEAIRRQLDSQPDKITLNGLIEELRNLASEAREAGITISGLKEAISAVVASTKNLSAQVMPVNKDGGSKNFLGKDGEYDLSKMSREDISKVYANSNKLSDEYLKKHKQRMSELDADLALMKERDLTDEELRKRVHRTPEQQKQLEEERNAWLEMERAGRLAAKDSAELLRRNQEHDEEIARLREVHPHHPEIKNLEQKKAENHGHLEKAKVVLDKQQERYDARDKEALKIQEGLDTAAQYKRSAAQMDLEERVKYFEFKHKASHTEVVKAAKAKLEVGALGNGIPKQGLEQQKSPRSLQPQPQEAVEAAPNSAVVPEPNPQPSQPQNLGADNNPQPHKDKAEQMIQAVKANARISEPLGAPPASPVQGIQARNKKTRQRD